jgi:hypothetical protein
MPALIVRFRLRYLRRFDDVDLHCRVLSCFVPNWQAQYSVSAIARQRNLSRVRDIFC